MKTKSDFKKELKERKEAYKCLPPNIKNLLTEEETQIFLNEEVWPETLCDKLKDFIVKTP